MNMPFAHPPADDDRRLREYILGMSSEEDTERLDEASIADDAVAARLRAVEDDLVDAYVRGRLNGQTLDRFQRWYLLSPRRRDKVAFARSFALAVEYAAATEPAAARPRLRGVWQLTAVAALLVAVCAGLVLQMARTNRPTSDMQPAIALVLTPQTRSVGPVPALRLPPGATRVTFELRLDGSPSSRYQIGLRDPAVNRVVWRSGWTPAVNAALTISLPATVFRPQHYSLDLFTRDDAADDDVAASYAFEIASP